MEEVKKITAATLRNWLQQGIPLSVIDIRPLTQRMDAMIPGSLHINAYDQLKQNDVTALDSLHLDKSIPVVTYCAGGGLSVAAAALLQTKGYTAYSLEGGMNAWNN